MMVDVKNRICVGGFPQFDEVNVKMDFPKPSDVVINDVSRELLKEVDSLSSEVNSRRPIPEEILKKIKEELTGRNVHNSSGIEGNTFTLRETKEVLKTGSVIDVGRKREATETINLGNAIEYVQGIAENHNTWADADIFLKVHEKLMNDLLEDSGCFRHQGVMISGAKYQPPSADKIDSLMVEFFGSLRTALESQKVHPVVIATWVHWSIARIHPFKDGNGRMARLWQDLILFGNHLTAAIIPQQSREAYYQALISADDGKFDPLVQMIANAINDSFNVYLNAFRESDEIQDWAKNILGESRVRSEQKLQLEYLSWSRKMRTLRDTFQRCANQVTSQSDGSIEIQVNGFDIIEQATWELLRSGSPAGKTWFFWLNFRKDHRHVNYCFFFGRHLSSHLDETLSEIHPSPCLLISEESDGETAIRLDDSIDHPVTLRELLVINNQLIRKRFDREKGEVGEAIYDEGIDPLVVATDMIKEVLLYRLAE
ncbi:MAG: Fic family protein [Planctomycetaceae bacterium]|nr:Fic family protein [Planctomycetaceae bacterium]